MEENEEVPQPEEKTTNRPPEKVEAVREKIDLSFVMEEVQKEHKVENEGKRDPDEFDTKELEQFETAYKMLPDKAVADIFQLTIRQVKNLASKLEIYKDESFTQNQLMVSKEGHYLSIPTNDGSVAQPGFLVEGMEEHITEEEYRSVITNYLENFDAKKMMEDLIAMQAMRVRRGFALEYKAKGVWMSVNAAADALMNMILKYHEMEHGTKQTHILTLNDYVLRSQKGQQQ